MAAIAQVLYMAARMRKVRVGVRVCHLLLLFVCIFFLQQELFVFVW